MVLNFFSASIFRITVTTIRMMTIKDNVFMVSIIAVKSCKYTLCCISNICKANASVQDVKLIIENAGFLCLLCSWHSTISGMSHEINPNIRLPILKIADIKNTFRF